MPNVILIRNQYPDKESLFRVLEYALSGIIVGGYGTNPDYAYSQMMMVKQAYRKTDGVQLKHFALSFSHHEFMELDWEDVLKIAYATCHIFCEYQIAFSIHVNADHIHVHFVMNTVSFLDGRKYAAGHTKFYEVLAMLKSEFPQFENHFFQSRKYSEGSPYSIDDMGVFELIA